MIILQWRRSGVYMQAAKARCAAQRERVFRDRGNPTRHTKSLYRALLTVQYRFRREDFEITQELKLPAIEPGTGRNAAVNQLSNLG